MPINRKVLLDKAAWAWAETIDHADITNMHLETAYRIKLKACKPGSCRRTCRGNPHCLSGIGERNWLGDIADETWHKGEDPDAERRSGNSFVGLRNLGATCYVNSLLQLWFHNLAFRRAVYLWKPKGVGAIEKADGTIDAANSVAHLQHLFALMQFGPRKYLDPTDFVLSLGLDTMTQQDAQEFSKLFLTMLEEQLAAPAQLPEVRDMVHSQFLGEYDYVTRCLHCGTESACPSTFYELDLNISSSGNTGSSSGNSPGKEESVEKKPPVSRNTLDEFLLEFLHEEKLEGADRYHCVVCGCKQDATRSIKLRRLPPVLTLQLLRFVFDRTIGHKKKLNSFVYFPKEIDMAHYMGQSTKPLPYSLCAVLAHKGSSAYSGHYLAHIRDTTSGEWHRFNDEAVEKMEGKKLELGCDEDVLDTKKKKRPRVPKGQLSSNNAYMLVYVKVDSVKEEEQKGSNNEAMELEELPPHLFEIVNHEKEEFEAWVASQKQSRDMIVQSGKERQAEIRFLYEMLPVNLSLDDVISTEEGATWDFISVDWLMKWLEKDDDANKTKEKSEKSIPMVDHAGLLCPHGRLRPDLVTSTKCVSRAAADVIYERFGGGPRLLGRESMCRECVTSRCKSIRLRAKTAQDAQTMATLLKSCDGSERGYWVGKASLRSWRRMALEEEEEHEADNGGMGDGDGNATDAGEHPASMVKDDSLCNGAGEDNRLGTKEEEVTLGFNCDIVCNHGNLSPKDNNRRVVPETVWCLLKGYFPGAPEFTSDAERCSKCEDMATEGQAMKNLFRKIACQQKETLSDLYLEKNRPSFESHNFTIAKIIPRDFLSEWRRFVREPNKRLHPPSLSCQDLICAHGGLLYDPCFHGNGDLKEPASNEEAISPETPCVDVEADSRLALIWDHEWAALKEYYSVDKEISASMKVASTEPETPLKTENLSEESMEVEPECVSADAAASLGPDSTSPVGPHVSLCESKESSVSAPTDGGGDQEKPGNVASSTPEDAATSPEGSQQANTGSHPTGSVVIEPPPCGICVRERLCRVQESLLNYSRAKVFIRKVPSGAGALLAAAKEDKDEDDPEFKATEPKRPRGKAANNAAPQTVTTDKGGGEGEVRRSTRDRRPRGVEAEVVVPSDSTLWDLKLKATESKRPRGDAANSASLQTVTSALIGEVRRSTRPRRTRGVEEVVVSSDSTLRDLKLKIMRIFSVAPFDQHLWLEGRPLLDPQATLSNLRVYPGSVITLKADEPWEDPMLLGDFDKDAAPEEGFKGTGLLSS